MRSKILGLTIGVIILICLAIAGGVSCLNLHEQTQEETQKEELKLSDFPDVFKNDTLIVIGENASQIEKESAEAIAAKLENLTGNKPIIKNETVFTEDNKTSYNLILVGTPESNSLLQEVYNLTNATKVTEEYPGKNKGILEILRNPWNEDKAMLLVEGSDEWGVKAATLKLEHFYKINEKIIITEWQVPNIPLGPVLKWPFNGAETTDHTISFGWYNVEDAQKYLLQVDNDADFSSPEIETYVVESQFTPEVPLLDDTYYWRVKTIYKESESMWSDTWKIMIFTASDPKNIWEADLT